MAIVILGESAAGKSTLERTLCDIYGYERVISYTTRPMRDGEQQDVDYHFVGQEWFDALEQEGFFAENTSYRGWSYGIAKEDLKDNRVIVVEPNGFHQLKQVPGLNLVSFYLKIPRRDRLIKILQRGDDVDEAIRRNVSDCELFKDIEREVDYIIENEGYHRDKENLAYAINYIMKNRK